MIFLDNPSFGAPVELGFRIGFKYFWKYLSQVKYISYLQVQVQVQVLKVLGRHQVHQVFFNQLQAKYEYFGNKQ